RQFIFGVEVLVDLTGHKAFVKVGALLLPTELLLGALEALLADLLLDADPTELATAVAGALSVDQVAGDLLVLVAVLRVVLDHLLSELLGVWRLQLRFGEFRN